MKLNKFFIVLVFIVPLVLNAQSFKSINAETERSSDARDQFILEFMNDGWLDLPEEIDYRGYSPGFNVYLMNDIFAKKDHPLSLGIGYGLSSHNVHTDGIFQEIDTNGIYTALVKFDNSVNLKKNKHAVTYMEVPIELRFISQDGLGFKIHLGGKIGYRIADHMKTIDSSGKRKVYNVEGINKWRYGLTGRIGYGKLTLAGFYSLTELFEENKGPKLIPYSIGIGLILF